MSGGNSTVLTVALLKQFVYCRRIFFYQAVEGLTPPITGLMERGRRLQEEFERLEPRRVLSRYGMEGAERHFSQALADEELKLSGEADLVLESEDRLAVVEFKASGEPLAENHRLQLAAYARMAEQRFGKPCPYAFALFVDRGEIEEIAVHLGLRDAVDQAVKSMHSILTEADFPPPTPVRPRCVNCEYRNFCGDVF